MRKLHISSTYSSWKAACFRFSLHSSLYLHPSPYPEHSRFLGFFIVAFSVIVHISIYISFIIILGPASIFLSQFIFPAIFFSLVVWSISSNSSSLSFTQANHPFSFYYTTTWCGPTNLSRCLHYFKHSMSSHSSTWSSPLHTQHKSEASKSSESQTLIMSVEQLVLVQELSSKHTTSIPWLSQHHWSRPWTQVPTQPSQKETPKPPLEAQRQ